MSTLDVAQAEPDGRSDTRQQLAERFHRIEALVDRLEQYGDPALRATARELFQRLLDLHGDALGRMVATAAGTDLPAAWGRDELVRGVLLLHGLHPDDPAARVRQALDGLRPLASAAGVEIHLVAVAEAVRVELVPGGPADEVALRNLRGRIDEAVAAAAPEVPAVAVTVRPGRIALPLVGPRS